MNKQELIGKIRALPYEEGVAVDTLKINRDGLIKLIEQFDEPQKVKIPDFVAEWIEYCKAHDFTLFGCIDPANDFEDLADETFKGDIRKCIRWCRRESNIFARAWLDGYTVEKEKQYLVKMKGIEGHNSYLKYNKNLKHWYFGSLFIYNNDVDARTYHTRKELEEAGFGWVFDCPGIEIEEVEK